MAPTGPHRYAIARAHVNADGMGKTYILAFNQAQKDAVVCCALDKFEKERPYGLSGEDIFYRAEPGTPIPFEIHQER